MIKDIIGCQVTPYRNVLCFTLLCLVLFIAGCGQTPPTTNVTNTPSTNEAYPAATDSRPPSSEAYPAPGVVPEQIEAYPSQTTATGILLALDKPIKAGNTTVTGVGPPGMAVSLVNITFMGTGLGSTLIGDDGTFSIQVSPLEANIRVGLSADPASAGLTESDIQLGEGAISVPQVGFFFDSALVLQE